MSLIGSVLVWMLNHHVHTIAALALLTFFVLKGIHRGTHWPELEEVAAALGLTLTRTGLLELNWYLEGTYREHPIKVHYWWHYGDDGKQARTPMLTCTLGGVHPTVTIRRHGPVVDVVQQAQTELKIGDAALDRLALLHGPEARLRAALDLPTRELLTDLLRTDSLTLQRGELKWAQYGHPEDIFELQQVLDRMCDLADAVAPGPVPVERLLELAANDPKPEVRALCLLSLLDEEPEIRQRGAALRSEGGTGVDEVARALLGGRIEEIDAQLTEPLRTLAALDPRRVVGALALAGARRALTRLLQSEGILSVEVRRSAAGVLESMGAEQAGGLSLVETAADAGAVSVAGSAGALSEGSG